MIEQKIEKINNAKQMQDRVLFAWRFKDRKLEGKYVSLTNLRLEVLQIHNGRMLYTQAAPILKCVRGSNEVCYYDNNVMIITAGKRAGITVLAETLKDGEEAHLASMLGTVEITNDTDTNYINKAYTMLVDGGYPGRDMRVPQLFRCTKQPKSLKVNYTTDLLKLIKAPAGATSDQLENCFVNSINKIGTATSSGFVIPFEYVYAGGMVVADGTGVTKNGTSYMQERSYDFFQQYVKFHDWKIQLIEETTDDFFRTAESDRS